MVEKGGEAEEKEINILKVILPCTVNIALQSPIYTKRKHKRDRQNKEIYNLCFSCAFIYVARVNWRPQASLYQVFDKHTAS